MKRLICILIILCCGSALAELPVFDGNAKVDIGRPRFSLPVTEGRFTYSPLDKWGRAAGAAAILGPESLSSDDRESLAALEPSGWQSGAYAFIPGLSLYHLCHLIGHRLGGEDILENLITGTQFLNISGMLPVENRIYDYIKQTGNHVRYEVTPIYKPGSLLCYGVTIDAQSVEDEGISLSVYCFNVQPGVRINFETGFNSLAETVSTEVYAQAEENVPSRTVLSSELTYVLNTNTKRYHYPDCPSCSEMKPKNRAEFAGDKAALEAMGYKPCGRCNP